MLGPCDDEYGPVLRTCQRSDEELETNRERERLVRVLAAEGHELLRRGLARQDVAGFETYASRIAAMFRARPRVLEDILEGLFHVALADGRYHEGEEEFLRTVARRFGVSPDAFDAIEARHLEGRRQDPWAVLGLPRDADYATARTRWRELVRAHVRAVAHALGA